MGKWLLHEAYLDWGRKAYDPSLPSPSSPDPDPHSDPALALAWPWPGPGRDPGSGPSSFEPGPHPDANPLQGAWAWPTRRCSCSTAVLVGAPAEHALLHTFFACLHHHHEWLKLGSSTCRQTVAYVAGTGTPLAAPALAPCSLQGSTSSPSLLGGSAATCTPSAARRPSNWRRPRVRLAETFRHCGYYFG